MKQKVKLKSGRRSSISGTPTTKKSESKSASHSGKSSAKKPELMSWLIWSNTSPTPQIKTIEKTQQPISGTKAGKMRYIKIL